VKSVIPLAPASQSLDASRNKRPFRCSSFPFPPPPDMRYIVYNKIPGERERPEMVNRPHAPKRLTRIRMDESAIGRRNRAE